MLIWCAHCRKDRPEEEFLEITPEKVVDDSQRPVRYAKHTCGWKTLKRATQPAGRRGKVVAA